MCIYRVGFVVYHRIERSDMGLVEEMQVDVRKWGTSDNFEKRLCVRSSLMPFLPSRRLIGRGNCWSQDVGDEVLAS